MLFVVVFSFSIMGALASMYYSKKHRETLIGQTKADSKRQEFISVAVNGIENVKGLALEPNLKEKWRDLEANFIIANEETQKKSAVFEKYNLNHKSTNDGYGNFCWSSSCFFWFLVCWNLSWF